MRVRLAQEEDVTEIVALGAMMHSESHYASLPYSYKKCVILGYTAIHNDNYLLCVVENDNDKIIGFSCCCITEHFFSKSTIAENMLVFVLPEYRNTTAFMRLLKFYNNWAKENNVDEICYSTTTGIKDTKTDKLFNKIGYELVGSIYKIQKKGE